MKKFFGISLVVLTGSLAFGQAVPSVQGSPVQPVPQPPAVVNEAVKQASPWAAEAVRFLTQVGIFIGREDTFDWKSPMIRQEVAMAIARLIAYYNLDKLKPDTIDALWKTIDEIKAQMKDLSGLPAQIKALQDQMRNLGPSASSADLQKLADQIKALQDQMKALQAMQGAHTSGQAIDLSGVNGQINGLMQKVAALEGRASELEKQMANLQNEVNTNARDAAAEMAKLKSELNDVRAQLKTHLDLINALTKRLSDLEAAIRTATVNISGQGGDLKTLADVINNLSKQIAELTSKNGQQDGQIAKLMSDLAAQTAQLDALQKDFATVKAVTMKNSEDIKDALTRITALEGRTGALEGRVSSLENRMTSLEGVVKVQGERIDNIYDKFLRPRNAFYISLAPFGIDNSGDYAGYAAIGHDAILGILGLRVSGDINFKNSEIMLAGEGTARFSFEDFDMMLGVGGGLNLDTNEPFGQFSLGMNYRFIPNFGLFAEGKARFAFDGTNLSNTFSVMAGLQIRF